MTRGSNLTSLERSNLVASMRASAERVVAEDEKAALDLLRAANEIEATGNAYFGPGD